MTEEIKQRIKAVKAGKVPSGYKKTPIGILPDDWITDKTLGDIGVFGKGKGIPGNMLGAGNVPCVGYGDIYMKYNHFHFEEAQSFVDEETAKESTPIQNGTLLFTGTGESAEEIVKCVCYNGGETIYAGGDIITFNNENVNPLFLAYQQYQDFSLKRKARLGQGHSVVHIQKGNLENLPVSYPDSDTEQQKITEILLKWDRAIELQEKLIEKLELQKKALMQKLLKPKENWKPVPLKKILRERKTYSTKGQEYIHVTLSKQGICDKTEQYERDFLVTSENKGYKITKLNDLCYNPANLKFGVICLNKYGDAIFSPIYVTFEISEIYNCDFIGAILTSESFINKIRRFEEGSLYERQAVKPNDFIKDTILIPNRHIQDNIAKIVLKINSRISLHNEKLNLLKHQQKAMHQLLLTGIVRV